jgi:hypothetical protein
MLVDLRGVALLRIPTNHMLLTLILDILVINNMLIFFKIVVQLHVVIPPGQPTEELFHL